MSLDCRLCGDHPQARSTGWCARCLDRENRRRRRLVNAATLADYFEVTSRMISRLPMFEAHASGGSGWLKPPAAASGNSRNGITQGDSQPVNPLRPTDHPGGCCEWCERPLAAFHAGRQVRGDRRFCGARCKQAAHRSGIASATAVGS